MTNPEVTLDPKIVDRYRKIEALAQRGSEGERETARRILQDFKARHPGVEEAARTQTQAPPPDPFGWNSNRGPTTPRGPTGNWENLFRYAQGFYNAYNTTREIIEEAVEAERGAELAKTISLVHGRKAGQLYLMLRVPFDTINKSRALNFLQKERFRAEVHAILDRALDALLEG